MLQISGVSAISSGERRRLVQTLRGFASKKRGADRSLTSLSVLCWSKISKT
jgi:hypothetical protein